MSLRAHERIGAVLLVGSVSTGCPTPQPVVPALPEGSTSSTTPAEGTSTTGSVDTSSGGSAPDSTSSVGTSTSEGSSSSSGEPAACGLGSGEGCLAPEDEPWMVGWAYRRQLQITSPLVVSLDDVVVPIVLDDSFEFDCALLEGSDLRFVDDDGIVLDHEIDEWVPGQGAVAWVRLPTLPPEGVPLWMYYGNASEVGLEAEVWPESVGYEAVLHFGDDLDDARGLHDGAPALEALPLYAQGVFGRAIHFEDVLVNTRVELDQSDLIDDAMIASEALTVTAWLRSTPDVDSPSNYRTIIGRGDDWWAMLLRDQDAPADFAPPVYGLFFSRCFAPECDVLVDPFRNHEVVGSVPVIEHPVLPIWRHLSIVYAPLGGGDHAKRVYVDGELDVEVTGPLPLQWSTMALHTAPLVIGAGVEDSELAVFHGEIDEIHIASTAFSPERVRAEASFGNPNGPSLVQIEPPECR